jgi:hypothetical protein
MTIYEGLSLLVAAVALVLSCAALWISIPLQRRQRQEIEEAEARRKTADVRVTLAGPPQHERFVIENVGQGTAYDVNLDLTPPEGAKSPLAGDYHFKMPIETLRGGDGVELTAKISTDTGVMFDAKWRWRAEDGRTENEPTRFP